MTKNLPTLSDQEAAFERNLPILHRGKGPYRQSVTAAHDSFFAVLCGLIQPDIIAEVGAHAAEFSSKMRVALPKVEILAFEANPFVYALHAERLQKEGVKYRNCAALDRTMKAEFKVPHNKEGKGDTSMSSINAWKNATAHDTFQVDAFPLDDILGTGTRNICLWIDVEGAAANVLRGASHTLRQSEAVYIELEKKSKWNASASLDEAHALLTDQGLLPLSRDIQQPDWQYNAVYVKPKWIENLLVKDALALYLGFKPNAG